MYLNKSNQMKKREDEKEEVYVFEMSVKAGAYQ